MYVFKIQSNEDTDSVMFYMLERRQTKVFPLPYYLPSRKNPGIPLPCYSSPAGG